MSDPADPIPSTWQSQQPSNPHHPTTPVRAATRAPLSPASLSRKTSMTGPSSSHRAVSSPSDSSAARPRPSSRTNDPYNFDCFVEARAALQQQQQQQASSYPPGGTGGGASSYVSPVPQASNGEVPFVGPLSPTSSFIQRATAGSHRPPSVPLTPRDGLPHSPTAMFGAQPAALAYPPSSGAPPQLLDVSYGGDDVPFPHIGGDTSSQGGGSRPQTSSTAPPLLPHHGHPPHHHPLAGSYATSHHPGLTPSSSFALPSPPLSRQASLGAAALQQQLIEPPAALKPSQSPNSGGGDAWRHAAAHPHHGSSTCPIDSPYHTQQLQTRLAVAAASRQPSVVVGGALPGPLAMGGGHSSANGSPDLTTKWPRELRVQLCASSPPPLLPSPSLRSLDGTDSTAAAAPPAAPPFERGALATTPSRSLGSPLRGHGGPAAALANASESPVQSMKSCPTASVVPVVHDAVSDRAGDDDAADDDGQREYVDEGRGGDDSSAAAMVTHLTEWDDTPIGELLSMLNVTQPDPLELYVRLVRLAVECESSGVVGHPSRLSGQRHHHPAPPGFPTIESNESSPLERDGGAARWGRQGGGGFADDDDPRHRRYDAAAGGVRHRDVSATDEDNEDADAAMEVAWSEYMKRTDPQFAQQVSLLLPSMFRPLRMNLFHYQHRAAPHSTRW